MPVFTEKTLGDSQLFVPASSFDLLQRCAVAHFQASEVDKDLRLVDNLLTLLALCRKFLLCFIYFGTPAQGRGEFKKK